MCEPTRTTRTTPGTVEGQGIVVFHVLQQYSSGTMHHIVKSERSALHVGVGVNNVNELATLV